MPLFIVRTIDDESHPVWPYSWSLQCVYHENL